MTDNPAVRAVAAAFCLHGGARLAGGECFATHRAVHPECALAALASSREVRAWLSDELATKARLKPGGEVTRYVGIVLRALGGKENA